MDINIAQNEDYFLGLDWYRLAEPTSVVEGLSYTVVTDLATEPITVQYMKDNARIDFNNPDQLLESYIKAARQYLEGWSQLSFGEKTVRFRALKVPNKWELMNGPYVSIETVDSGFNLFGNILRKDGIWYRDTNRELYDVDLTLKTRWDPLPEAIKLAIAKQAAWFYNNRESLVTSLEGAIQHKEIFDDEAKMLLNPFRNITFP